MQTVPRLRTTTATSNPQAAPFSSLVQYGLARRQISPNICRWLMRRRAVSSLQRPESAKVLFIMGVFDGITAALKTSRPTVVSRPAAFATSRPSRGAVQGRLAGNAFRRQENGGG